MITATLYATFRLIAGVKTIEIIAFPGLTVRQAVDAVLEQAPALRPHWLDEFGELYPHVHIFLNGTDAATLADGEQTALQPGDSLDFFPPVAGG